MHTKIPRFNLYNIIEKNFQNFQKMSDEDKLKIILKSHDNELFLLVIHGRSDKMLLPSDYILGYIYLCTLLLRNTCFRYILYFPFLVGMLLNSCK